MDGIVVPSGGYAKFGCGLGHSWRPLLVRGGRHRARASFVVSMGEDAEVSIGPARRAPAIIGEDGGSEDPGANRVVCLGSPTVMRGYLRNGGVATPTRSPRTAACGRATSGWRTSPGGYIYPGTAQSATSAAATTSTGRRLTACWRTSRTRRGRRAPERRRSGRRGRGGGGASAGPRPEHTPDAWRSCVTLPRSVWPT